jgi:hypothetical protein
VKSKGRIGGFGEIGGDGGVKKFGGFGESGGNGAQKFCGLHEVSQFAAAAAAEVIILRCCCKPYPQNLMLPRVYAVFKVPECRVAQF